MEMPISWISSIVTFINIALYLVIIILIIKGIRGIKNFMNRNKQIEKKLDTILNELEKKND